MSKTLEAEPDRQQKAIKSESSATFLNVDDSLTDEEDGNQWAILPEEALLKVMIYLDDADRVSAARVCRLWRCAFHSPLLWRRRKFRFAGIQAICAAEQARNFFQALGLHLRHLTLECGPPTLQTARPIAQAVETFVTGISSFRTKLLSIRVESLDIAHGWRFYEAPRAKLLTALGTFLKKQKHLRRLDLSGAKMNLRDGTAIMDICGKSLFRSQLTSLILRDFFDLSVEAFHDAGFRQALRRFSHLRHVYLNYAYLDGTTLLKLGRKWRHTLHTLEIVVESVQHSSHVITPVEWQQTLDSCPHLKVVFHFLGMMTLSEYRRVLVLGVPVEEVDILSWDTFPGDRTHPETERMADIIKHIAQSYRHRLERFRLSMDHVTTPPVDEALLHLFRTCNSLRELSVNCYMSIPIVQLLCQEAGLRAPGVLDRMELRVRGLAPSDVGILMAITEKYLGGLGYRRLEVQSDF